MGNEDSSLTGSKVDCISDTEFSIVAAISVVAVMQGIALAYELICWNGKPQATPTALPFVGMCKRKKRRTNELQQISDQIPEETIVSIVPILSGNDDEEIGCERFESDLLWGIGIGFR